LEERVCSYRACFGLAGVAGFLIKVIFVNADIENDTGWLLPIIMIIGIRRKETLL
jgi:hypothetical protein